MEEKDFAMEAIVERMEEMKLEIASIKEAMTANEDAPKATCPTIDFSKIRSMLEEGFEKVADALRPLAERADRNIGKPARAVVEKAEEKIVVNPFAAVAIALGAGLIIGKLISMSCPFSYDDDDDE